MIICLDPLDGSVCVFLFFVFLPESSEKKKNKLGKMAITDHETMPLRKGDHDGDTCYKEKKKNTEQ